PAPHHLAGAEQIIRPLGSRGVAPAWKGGACGGKRLFGVRRCRPNTAPDHLVLVRRVQRVDVLLAVNRLVVDNERITPSKFGGDALERFLHRLSNVVAAEVGVWFISEGFRPARPCDSVQAWA